MGKDRIIIRIVLVLLFFVSLYLVEAGFCGSSVVAKYNNGFGTLDMKLYDVDMVKQALGPMNAEGLRIYKLYYLMDFIFVIFFGAIQLVMINDIYSFTDSRILAVVVSFVPLFRGICDIIENIILLRSIYIFPRINEVTIMVSSRFTWLKLMSIRLWAVMLVFGILWRFIARFIEFNKTS